MAVPLKLETIELTVLGVIRSSRSSRAGRKRFGRRDDGVPGRRRDSFLSHCMRRYLSERNRGSVRVQKFVGHSAALGDVGEVEVDAHVAGVEDDACDGA